MKDVSSTVARPPFQDDGGRVGRTLLRSLAVTIPFIAAGLLLPRELTVLMFALLLGVAAGVYPGFALQRPTEGSVVMQWTVALSLTGLAWLGVWWKPALVGVAWLLHAVWDYLHCRGPIPTPTSRDYPLLCLFVDIPWGIFVLALAVFT